MDKKRVALVIIGLILIIILLAVKSTEPAIATNSNGNKTFSNGGISFEYPQNWQESSTFLDQIFSLDFMGILSGNTLGDLSSPTGSYDLMIQKYSLSSFNANSTQDFLDKNRKEMEDSNSTIISENTTNVNGLTIYEMLTYSTLPDNTHQETFFAIVVKDQRVYILQFNPTSIQENAETNNGTDLNQNSKVLHDSIPRFQKIISTIKVD